MRLPNGERAVISDEKLFDFLLNPDHEYGVGHAYLFESLLGITRINAEHLRTALLDAAANGTATPGKSSTFGEKYEIRFPMTGPRHVYRSEHLDDPSGRGCAPPGHRLRRMTP